MKYITKTQSLVWPLAAAFVCAVALAGCQPNEAENAKDAPAAEGEHPTKTEGEHPTKTEGEHPTKTEGSDKKEHPSN